LRWVRSKCAVEFGPRCMIFVPRFLSPVERFCNHLKGAARPHIFIWRRCTMRFFVWIEDSLMSAFGSRSLIWRCPFLPFPCFEVLPDSIAGTPPKLLPRAALQSTCPRSRRSCNPATSEPIQSAVARDFQCSRSPPILP
jgi:hypothetical protein